MNNICIWQLQNLFNESEKQCALRANDHWSERKRESKNEKINTKEKEITTEKMKDNMPKYEEQVEISMYFDCNDENADYLCLLLLLLVLFTIFFFQHKFSFYCCHSIERQVIPYILNCRIEFFSFSFSRCVCFWFVRTFSMSARLGHF